MLGWMILFGLLTLCGLLASLTGPPADMQVLITNASFLFASIFILFAATRILRNRPQ